MYTMRKDRNIILIPIRSANKSSQTLSQLLYVGSG